MSVPELLLTDTGYYSLEANQQYMSMSQFKDLMNCEAAAVAKIRGEWKEEPSDAMLAGSYVHAAMEGTLEGFKESHPEMFTKQGGLKSAFQTAENMIATIQSDEFITDMLDGGHEHPIIAEFAGVMWKAKLDVYNPGKGRIVDLKTVKNIYDKAWSKQEGRYVSVFDSYHWVTQLAVYSELERLYTGRDNRLDTYIVAVSKEDVPDKAVIHIDEERIEQELEWVKANLDRAVMVKLGYAEPVRCEHCKYCRSTKKISQAMSLAELEARI